MNSVGDFVLLLLVVVSLLPDANHVVQKRLPLHSWKRRPVRAYVLSMQQQQASDDEIYEGMNKMCNEIGCPLKFYEDTILPFEDTSGAAASA